ncbi:alpha-amylase family glycosyl hydrolase [Thermodesulfobacteriota bacterium]
MTWLKSLSRREGRSVTLKDIPLEEWRNLKEIGIDIVWLMGMWQRSPYSKNRARQSKGLVDAGRNLLPDFTVEDVDGSPYAIYEYIPDDRFGTLAHLEALKRIMEDEGLFLILDFVPNHTACDNPWTKSHLEYFVHTKRSQADKCPDGFFPRIGCSDDICIAHGKDPYFPPWDDTAQVNYSNKNTSEAMADLLCRLSDYCHGLRCDMAMLPLKEVFQETWKDILNNECPDFWPGAIEKLRAKESMCILIAEVYWGKEPELLEYGFDYTYDKLLYDLMVKGDIQGLKGHIALPVEYQEYMVRFMENHDEPRALKTFGYDRIESAMVIHATLPGMRFWQYGQFEGRKYHYPVQFSRSPDEPEDRTHSAFCKKLLIEVDDTVFHEGTWAICATHGWPDNDSHKNLLAWCWTTNNTRRLIIVNFSNEPVEGYIDFPKELYPHTEGIVCRDLLSNDIFRRSTAEVKQEGLCVFLDSFDFHFFNIEAVPK